MALTGRINLANTLILGRLSTEDIEQARAILVSVRKLLPAEDPRRVNVITIQGAALAHLERYEESAKTYAEALALAESTPHTRASLVAHIAAREAEALWSAGSEGQALKAAHHALKIYETLPEKAESRAELDEWINEREKKRD